MYCERCGTLNPDDSKFCSGCGAPLINAAPQPDAAPGADGQDAYYTQSEKDSENLGTQETGAQTGNAGEGTAQNIKPQQSPADSKKPLNKKLIGIIAAAAAVVVVLVIVLASSLGGKPKVDLVDSLEATYSGADGYGTVSVDYSDEWYDELEETLLSLDYSEDEVLYEVLYEFFYYDTYFTCAVEPTEGLSNGDVVTVTITVNEDAAEDLPIKLIGGTKEFTVEGLEDAETIDLFEGIEVTYSGTAPYATVDSVSTDWDDYVSFSWDSDEELAIGDTITITAEYDEDELLDYGYLVQSDTYELTVEDGAVSSYVQSLSEIPDEAMEKMKSQADDVMEAHVASDWYEDEGKQSYDGMEYLGAYFLVPKEGAYDSWSMYHNIIYLVYKVDCWDDSVGDLTYYTAFKYTDIMILTDGTCSIDLDDCDMPSTHFETNDSAWYFYYYYGYQTLDSMFSDYVTSNIDDYEYESTVTEE